MKNYTAIDLVSTNDMGYRRHGRFFKKIINAHKQTKKYLKNTIGLNYQKELSKWENIVRAILSSVIEEEEKRILKYTCDGDRTYREIDFIGKYSGNKLIFCEIKLKQTLRGNLSPSNLGWSQLNKSLNVAKNKFINLGGVAICVDMSHLYDIDGERNFNNYTPLAELKKNIKSSFNEKNVIWLDSQEVSNYALKNKLITHEQIEQLRTCFIALNNPFSFLSKTTERINNPFSMILQEINVKNSENYS